MQVSNTKRKLPISKDKVKAVLDIMDVAHAFSGQVNTRPKQPLILCPFHDDKHLGSCRVYTDTNTFYCESCQTSGDALKLASGYMGIPLNQMNELLEEIVSRFGINRESVTVDSTSKPTISFFDTCIYATNCGRRHPLWIRLCICVFVSRLIPVPLSSFFR